MNKFIYPLFCLFIFSFFTTSAQSVERTFRPEFFSTPNFIVPHSDNQIMVGGKGQKEYPSSPNPFLVMLDTLGNVLWEHDFLENFQNHSKVVVEDVLLEDESFLVKVSASCCCDVGLSPIFFRMNDLGQILDSIPINPYNEIVKFENQFISFEFLTISLWDSIFQHIGSEIFIPNNGAFIPFTDIINSGSEILVSSIENDESCGLMKVSISEPFPTFISIDTTCLGYSDIQNMEVVEGEGIVFIQNDNRIVALDANFAEVDEFIFHDSIEITNFIISENKIVVFTDSLSSREVRVFDLNFNLLENIVFEENLKLIPKHAFINNNKLFLVGEERSEHQSLGGSIFLEDDSRSSIFFRTYDLGEVNVFPFHDIGISQVSIAELPIVFPSTCSYYEVAECGTTNTLTYENILVTIKNYGNTILNECTVNARYEPCGNCNYFCDRTLTYSAEYKNLDLLPGESVEVLFGDMEIEDQIISNTHELCIWTANPNNLIDKDIANDQSCLESDVLVSIAEIEDKPIEIFLYPNPSNIGEVTLNITPENSKKEVIIFDALGEVVARYFLDKNVSNLILDTSLFSAGVYFLSVQSKSYSISKKLVTY